ncbi:LLM class flavin-dependent oxidoreductase [Mesorhizobium sp. LHD-90]|uniref:LLM class flavin-dependent oxidoreductase n=1 Tax=Mesorhizobium sp. LHD-90 TaxID=3071414 RepID=UPI0027E1A040|nr:LLM class flavin-dependent oxidoreductase [Mesorhizobium sp. LHD-90]MDQ6437658.1 LLM class flavin-dependent oxidoreductase [Mesorhizobium sp. LHD-90]
MQVEFTYLPGPHRAARGGAETPFFFDFQTARRLLTEVERAGFERVVVDDAGGLLSNMDLAAQAIRSTRVVDISLTHWADTIEPAVAARQLAALDRLGGGRLSVRVTTAFGVPASHVETLQRTDEYLVLLKRLWANDEPFDHEGPAYSLRNGFVARKGPRGAEIPFRMNGLSGTAFRVAGRHADVFELPFAEADQLAHVIERVRQAAVECGRAGRPKFALPLDFGNIVNGLAETAKEGKLAFGDRSPERITLALLPYVSIGVSEFMVSGLNDRKSIADFGERVIPIVKNSTARHDKAEVSWPHSTGTVPVWPAHEASTARH